MQNLIIPIHANNIPCFCNFFISKKNNDTDTIIYINIIHVPFFFLSEESKMTMKSKHKDRKCKKILASKTAIINLIKLNMRKCAEPVRQHTIKEIFNQCNYIKAELFRNVVTVVIPNYLPFDLTNLTAFVYYFRDKILENY